MIWSLRCKNSTVTDYYFKIIEESVSIYDEVKVTYNIKDLYLGYNKDIYIVGTIVEALKLLMKKKKNIILWIQGLEPEESYMRNESIIRKVILEIIERIVLKKSKFIYMVSNAMLKHYESKYKLNLAYKTYIMPCFNTEIEKQSFLYKDKYRENNFVYIGSLSPWQGFDVIAKCYKEIEDSTDNTMFYIFTKEKNEAKQILDEIKVKNYQIDYVSNEQLNSKIRMMKFGFVIREDNLVNNVSTPTKLSSYLGNGIIPIFSKSILDFYEVTKKMNYKIVHCDKFILDIKKYLNMDIDSNKVYDEYDQIFKSYYSKEVHISNSRIKLESIIDFRKKK